MRRIAIALALVLAPLVARAGFTFPVPAGWLDLSPGAPEANFAQLPPQYRALLRSPSIQSFAADLSHTVDGFTPNVNVVLVEGNARITAEKVDEAARGMLEAMQQQVPGVRLVDKGLTTVDGVKALRIVYDAEPGGRALRQMAIVIPGVPKSAVVTYSALRSQFDAMRPAFDAHATSIRGAREASLLERIDGGQVARATLGGAILGAIVGGVVALVRRRRKRAG
jgi:hypothetical protein